MRTIAVVNQKGGCGKTTTAVNLAACLAAEGARVLVLDMDPKAHATRALGIDPESRQATAYEILTEPHDGSALVRATVPVAERLDIVPSARTLGAIEPKLAGLEEERRTGHLRLALSRVAARYDFAIVDTPPALGLLTFCALRSARRVIVPVEASCLNVDDASWLIQAVGLVCERLEHPVDIRVLPTRFDGRTRFAREMLARIREHFPDACFDAVIRTNVRLQEAAERGRPVVRWAARSNGSSDHFSLAHEVQEWIPRSLAEVKGAGFRDSTPERAAATGRAPFEPGLASPGATPAR